MPATDHLRYYCQLIESIVGHSAAIGTLPNLPREPVLDQLIKHQQPSGAFLAPDPKIHPESRWFDEMVILHAAANRAVTTGDPVMSDAVRKGAEYHLREIQPDHATADPWGLLAYIQYAPPLADQVLHAMRMQYPDGLHGTALLLLADVLYGLRLLITEKT